MMVILIMIMGSDKRVKALELGDLVLNEGRGNAGVDDRQGVSFG